MEVSSTDLTASEANKYLGRVMNFFIIVATGINIKSIIK